MSCNQFADGLITIPKNEYNKLVKRLSDAYLAELTTATNRYNEFVTYVLEINKGKRHVNWHQAWWQATNTSKPFSTAEWEILDRIDYPFFSDTKIKPKKYPLSNITKFIKKFTKAAKSTDMSLHVDRSLYIQDCTLFFNKKDSTIEFSIAQNNRAVDRVLESSLYKTFIDALNDVKWTRNSGGVVMYNHEYNIEAMGSPFVLFEYPKTNAKTK